MMIINGEEMKLPENVTVLEMLKSLNINAEKVVVEVDMEIVDKSQYSMKKLGEDSKVEIIRFVGGG